jgi:hypothetical protein
MKGYAALLKIKIEKKQRERSKCEMRRLRRNRVSLQTGTYR